MRYLIVVSIIAFGCLSLLATSEPPETLNLSLGVSVGQQDYYGDIEVCPSQPLVLQWSVSSGEATLSATPAENLEPLLENTSVPQTGEMPINVKDDVSVTLFNKTSSGATAEIQMNLGLRPENDCEVLTFLPAQYQGVLNQTLPQVASLERNLQIYVVDTRIEALLSNVGDSVYLSCSVIAVRTLGCSQGSEPDAFKLEGQITSTTFEGTYEGVQKGSGFEVSTSGSFEFVKDSAGE